MWVCMRTTLRLPPRTSISGLHCATTCDSPTYGQTPTCPPCLRHFAILLDVFLLISCCLLAEDAFYLLLRQHACRTIPTCLPGYRATTTRLPHCHSVRVGVFSVQLTFLA